MLSIVTISRPANPPTDTRHDRAGVPSICTVQAPHSPAPHPNLVPVKPIVSRSTHKSGVSASTSSSKLLPLTMSAIIAVPPQSFELHAIFGAKFQIPFLRADRPLHPGLLLRSLSHANGTGF